MRKKINVGLIGAGKLGTMYAEYSYKVINGESIPSEIPVRIELITKESLQK